MAFDVLFSVHKNSRSYELVNTRTFFAVRPYLLCPVDPDISWCRVPVIRTFQFMGLCFE
jgi:hypothetical protein